MAAPKTTRLSNDVTAPQPTAAGDAPYDTYDKSEQAISVTPDKAAAAADGYLTVNAVVEGDGLVFPSEAAVTARRVEVLTSYGPDGTTSTTLIHDYDRGITAEPTDWAATTAFAAGVYVLDTGEVYEVTTAGTSDDTEPTWPSTVGGTVTDGTAVWTRRL